MGVWIEILRLRYIADFHKSLPAWECGLKSQLPVTVDNYLCHSLRGSVDWNTWNIFDIFCLPKSLPAWECGLKCNLVKIRWVFFSHSLRGSVDWNLLCLHPRYQCKCHSLRGSVDWNWDFIQNLSGNCGHSLRGSVDWNIFMLCVLFDHIPSLPAWECGLKSLPWIKLLRQSLVTPCVGVWIEIIRMQVKP